jgi:hypothetical protein
MNDLIKKTIDYFYQYIEPLDYTDYAYLKIEIPVNQNTEMFGIQEFKDLLKSMNYREVHTIVKLINGTFYVYGNRIEARLKKEHVSIFESLERTINHFQQDVRVEDKKQDYFTKMIDFYTSFYKR